MESKVAKILQEIGLGDKQAKILVTLLEQGPLRAVDLAKAAHLNRTTTYGILKELVAKGLISSLSRHGIKEFQSIEPGLLIDYVERMQKNLEKQKRNIADELPRLESLREKRDIFPRLQFFEGAEGIKQAYEDTLSNNEGKVLYDFTGTDALFKFMGAGWAEDYLTRRTKLGIRCYDIAPDSVWSRASQKRDKEFLRTTELIPAQYNFDTEVNVYDNKVTILSFAKHQPIAVIIEDQNIATTMKKIFEYINNTLQPKGASQDNPPR